MCITARFHEDQCLKACLGLRGKVCFMFPFAETLANGWQHVECSAGGGHG